jgi:hypothetical protein
MGDPTFEDEAIAKLAVSAMKHTSPMRTRLGSPRHSRASTSRRLSATETGSSTRSMAKTVSGKAKMLATTSMLNEFSPLNARHAADDMIDLEIDTITKTEKNTRRSSKDVDTERNDTTETSGADEAYPLPKSASKGSRTNKHLGFDPSSSSTTVGSKLTMTPCLPSPSRTRKIPIAYRTMSIDTSKSVASRETIVSTKSSGSKKSESSQNRPISPRHRTRCVDVDTTEASLTPSDNGHSKQHGQRTDKAIRNIISVKLLPSNDRTSLENGWYAPDPPTSENLNESVISLSAQNAFEDHTRQCPRMGTMIDNLASVSALDLYCDMEGDWD